MLGIFASGGYRALCDDTLEPLKTVVTDTLGQPVRRIDRFIQLALIGAGRCTADRQLPSDTAVMLASAYGDLEVTIDVLNTMYVDHFPPKPLQFINTVSNAACYYIARHLGLQSSSNFVSRREHAFLAALQLAALDLQHRRQRQVLLGMVEPAVAPLTQHRQRLGIAADRPILEHSDWFLLAPDDAQHLGPPLGHIAAITQFDNAQQAVASINDSAGSEEQAYYLWEGPPQQQTQLPALAQTIQPWPDEQAATSGRLSIAWGDFLTRQAGASLFFIGASGGRYSVVHLKRSSA